MQNEITINNITYTRGREHTREHALSPENRPRYIVRTYSAGILYGIAYQPGIGEIMENARRLWLDQFKTYLDSNGIAYRPGKGVAFGEEGAYQILQVQTPDNGVQCIFSKPSMPYHYEIQSKLMPLVIQFLEEAPK